MKVCNLGTVTHLEDIMQMSDYICTEAHLLIIVPAFDRIKRSLQEISIHLFRAEQEKPLSLPKHRSHPISSISGNWQTARSASPTNADYSFRENTFLRH